MRERERERESTGRIETRFRTKEEQVKEETKKETADKIGFDTMHVLPTMESKVKSDRDRDKGTEKIESERNKREKRKVRKRRKGKKKNRTNLLSGLVLCKRQSILPLGHSTLVVEMRKERKCESM